MNEKLSEDMRAEHWKCVLRENGYRLTPARIAVIDVLAGTQHALDATQVFDLARRQYPALGLVSVYRTLEILVEMSLIQRVHHHDGCHAYIAEFSGHQHLLVCQSCGRIEFFEGDDLGDLFARVALESDYEISNHWLQLYGLCPECRAVQKKEPR